MEDPTTEQLTAVRLFVLQRAIGALIVTHPDPGKFAQIFGAATGIAQIEHATSDAPASFRQEAAQFARELIDLAEDEAAFRLQQKGEEG